MTNLLFRITDRRRTVSTIWFSKVVSGAAAAGIPVGSLKAPPYLLPAELNFRRKGKQRLPVRNPSPLATPEALNQNWSVKFIHDALICGRCFRTFNAVDDANREALSIEIDLNLPAQRVVRVLDRIAANRGYPVMLRMDNGAEFISLTLAEWAEKHTIKLKFIKPGKPTQNAFIEGFNRTYRTKILDLYLFRTLNEVREMTERGLSAYNNERPHESLTNMTLKEYRLQHHKAGILKNAWNQTGSIYTSFSCHFLHILLDSVYNRI